MRPHGRRAERALKGGEKMPVFLLAEVGETVPATVDTVFTGMTSVFTMILSMFSKVVTTITGNPLLYVPVLIALLGGVVMFAIGVIRRLGVRGVSSGGRRRRRRRA